MSLQVMLSEPLLSRLFYIRLTPKKILCISTDDNIVKIVKSHYPTAAIDLLSPDNIKSLAICDSQYDLIVSIFAFISGQDRKLSLAICHQALKEKGLLLFVTLGPESYTPLLSKTHFIDMHHIGDDLKQLRFQDPVMDREEIELCYRDFEMLQKEAALLHVFITNDREKNAVKKQENYVVSLELLFGHGWKLEHTRASE